MLFKMAVTSLSIALFIIFVVVCFCAFFLKRIVFIQRPLNFPTGPPSFRILGNFPSLLLTMTSPTKVFANFSRFCAKYEKVVYLDLAGTPAVVISDAEVLRKSFSEPAFCGRPLIEQIILQADKTKRMRGLALNYGDTFKEVRKFVVSQLRELGLGEKNGLEVMLNEEIELTLQYFGDKAKKKETISTKSVFNIPSFNVLWRVISGHRFQWNDPEVTKLLHYFQRLNDCSYQLVLILMYPNLTKNKLVSSLVVKDTVFFAQIVMNWASSFVYKRRAQFLKKEQQHDHNDFTQAFLQKIQLTTEKNDTHSSFFGQVGYENLVVVIRDLFIGGTETTSTTLSWLLFYLALHPDKQAKLQQEIDHVLGGHAPTLQDKPKMLYTEAVINETLRKSSVLPMGFFHCTAETAKIKNYTLPENVLVFSNLYAIHHCETTWKDPFTFRPERFLDDDGSKIIKPEAFLPFSTGKRSCPGEHFARAQLFLFTTSIFQQFTILLNPKEKNPGLEAWTASVLTPLPHTLVLTPRKQQGG